MAGVAGLRGGDGGVGRGVSNAGLRSQAEDWDVISRAMGSQGRCVSSGGVLCCKIPLE